MGHKGNIAAEVSHLFIYPFLTVHSFSLSPHSTPKKKTNIMSNAQQVGHLIIFSQDPSSVWPPTARAGWAPHRETLIGNLFGYMINSMLLLQTITC